MKRLLLIATIALASAIATPPASAQTGNFVYTGVPTGPVAPGASFTVGLSIAVTTGGNVNDLSGFSYWMVQSSPAGGPFPFRITARNPTGSVFTDYSSGLVYPQIMDPINRNPNGTTISTDLGALIATGLPGRQNGTHFIAIYTFNVLAGAAPGIYTIQNTTSTTPGVGGRISVWNDAKGDIAPIAASSFTVGVGVTPFLPSQVVSRKNHNGVPFDIVLPFGVNAGIECRSGGATDAYQVVFSFANPVTFNSASVITGVGTVNSTSGSGTTAVTVNLTNVNSAQWITVRLAGVTDGTNTSDFNVPMGVLVGDSNGDGVVNAGDALQARNRSGQAADATNFFSDVNLDGFINTGDWTIVRSRSGTFIP